MKLVRRLANLGYGSRKEVAWMFREGRVTDTDGEVLYADDVVPHEAVRVDGEPLDSPQGLLLALNKPTGVTCSNKDAGRVVYDLLPLRFRLRNPALSTVGRLDRDTSGLLLLTDDGQLLHRIIAPKSSVPKVYRATLAQDLRAMRIEAQISEADVGGVAEGQTVTFAVDAYPTLTFTGQVNQVRYEPVTNQGVVNYVAIVAVDNADLKLRPGMTANASIVTAKRENALRLPNSALRFRPPEGVAVAGADRPEGQADGEKRREHSGTWKRGEGRGDWLGREHSAGNESAMAARKTVYLLDEKGGLRGQPVELGISDGTWTEVSGPAPQEGDWIVVGTQTAADKEKSAKSGSSSPFMPRPPGPPPGR